jgi:hypothetical protein
MYTKEEKQKYFEGLRAKWQANKALAEADTDAKKAFEAMQAESPSGISYYGYFFCLQSMRSQGLAGLPYVDCKTFNGWKLAGFIVKKGEHAKIDGITWISGGEKKEGLTANTEADDGFMYPKNYKLFHKSQVEAIK